jgi:fused signal recognition particle receptor
MGEAGSSPWAKLRAGLSRTQERLREGLGQWLDRPARPDPEALEQLEESLLAADVGVRTSQYLLERLSERTRKSDLASPERLRKVLEELIAELLETAPEPRSFPDDQPRIVLVVGVNGSGKTTSIAKLAYRDLRNGRSVLLGAADTFRAAAVEQLRVWGERLGVEVLHQGPGADPGAVAFDAVRAARARGIARLYVDTAGRLHQNQALLAELARIRRIVQREAGDWPIETLLVLDATVGQAAVAQGRAFLTAAEVDTVLLAKLDGTARGGSVLALVKELRLPLRYLGVGEGPEDLLDFDPRAFARALLADDRE